MEEITKIKLLNDKIKVSSQKDNYMARSIIICTGSRHRELEVPGEHDFIGRGVCYCAVCDGPLFKGRDVFMVGGGNTAVQEALYLKNIGCNVTIVHRRDELRAEKYLQDKLPEKNIPVIWNSVVEEIKGKDRVESVVLLNRETGEKQEIRTDGVFIAIGEIPSNDLATGIGVELDRSGYILTDKSQRTNIPKVYAAGDITGGIRQWVVACAEGAVASLSVYNDLMKE